MPFTRYYFGDYQYMIMISCQKLSKTVPRDEHFIDISNFCKLTDLQWSDKTNFRPFFFYFDLLPLTKRSLYIAILKASFAILLWIYIKMILLSDRHMLFNSYGKFSEHHTMIFLYDTCCKLEVSHHSLFSTRWSYP